MMNVYKDIRKKRRLRSEKKIQDACRRLDQMLGRTNLSDQISDKTEITKPTNRTLESVSKADFTYDVPKGLSLIHILQKGITSFTPYALTFSHLCGNYCSIIFS